MRSIKIVPLMLILVPLFCGKDVFAQAAAFSKKDEVVGRILLQLPRYAYLTRPSDQSATLCILNDVNLFSYLQELNGKRRVYKNIYSSPEKNCPYVYVGGAQNARKLLRSETEQSSIYISNYSNFISEGGSIAIVDNEGRVEIYLNITAAQRHNANFSPDLIEISKKVIQ